jgi:hypothetical protein
MDMTRPQWLISASAAHMAIPDKVNVVLFNNAAQ